MTGMRRSGEVQRCDRCRAVFTPDELRAASPYATCKFCDATTRVKPEAPRPPEPPPAPVLPAIPVPRRFIVVEDGVAARGEGPYRGLEVSDHSISIRWPYQSLASRLPMTAFTVGWCGVLLTAIVAALATEPTAVLFTALHVAAGVWLARDTYRAWAYQRWIRLDRRSLSVGVGRTPFAGGIHVRREDLDQIYVVSRSHRRGMTFEVHARDRTGESQLLLETESESEAWWIEQFLEQHFQLVDTLVAGEHRRQLPSGA
jgi:hypothetical protein